MVQSAVPLQGGGRPRPAGFNSATRLKRFQLPALSKTANAAQVTLRQDLPRVGDRKSTRLNSSHMSESRMPSSA